VFETLGHPTGGAAIIVDQVTGENAIVVVPGACFHVSSDDIDQARATIAQSAVFMTQLVISAGATLRVSYCGSGISVANGLRT